MHTSLQDACTGMIMYDGGWGSAWALVLKVNIHSPSRIHMQVYAGVLCAPSVWDCGGLIDMGR